MCGIAGLYDRGGAPADAALLERMAAAIAHRGPDGDGFYLDGGVGLAHRALRIIDLSDAAFQPMGSSDGECWLVFNGEIYNYVELMAELQARGQRFRSRSDSEVLLAGYRAWGVECLQHFNGMFAFAIWDRLRHRLFLARDRLGIKPLYYWWDGRRLAFASEIKALLCHPAITAAPNGAAIAEYWRAMYTTGAHTWFAGIQRLLPGEYLLVDQRKGLKIARYWDLPEQEDPPGRRETSYVEEVRHLLEDSVRLCLRSDVPLGAHLSGGVDSSAIVGLISRQLAGQPLETFSGAFDAGPAYDERPYIAAVSARWGTKHHETVPTAGDLPATLPRLVWHLDEPVAGPGAFPQYYVCKLTRASGVIVVNGGQGGDELFGGYFGYLPAYLRSLLTGMRRRPSLDLLAALLGDGVRLAAQPALRQAARAAFQAGRRGRLRPDTVQALPDFFGPALRQLDLSGPEAAPPAIPRRSPLGEALAFDLRHYLPALLQVEDRMSMAWSLESRVPLLDYRLVELAMRIPPQIKLRHLEPKHILRRAVADLLPAPVAARRDKKGFPTPIGPWFAGPLQGWVREQLLGPEAAARELFDPAAVGRLLDDHVAGRADGSKTLWMMLNTEAWFKQFIERSGSQAPAADAREPAQPAGSVPRTATPGAAHGR
ncbi:MAG TPA: asparagine synthase (glutamine-hydrolyzing) [Chloroflexia bacterium]|nr:asparagine synthase (glutamine-hydrolyzing) [Chloroflexia bacterium]